MNLFYPLLLFVLIILNSQTQPLSAQDIKIKKNTASLNEYKITVGKSEVATLHRNQSETGEKYTVIFSDGMDRRIERRRLAMRTVNEKYSKQSSHRRMTDYLKQYSFGDQLILFGALLVMVWIIRVRYRHRKK